KMPGDISRLALPELSQLLGHANLTVRCLATNEMVDRANANSGAAEDKLKVHRAALDATRDKNSPARVASGLWVLERLGAREATQSSHVDHPDRLVRIHQLRALAERPTWEAGIDK